ncbi:zinc finger MYND domain-containing protein [Phanerochaete sordida]|uniref:Zinc finger MYND domain-containing protein n=1 Tax=Phanerochaete sordida TaxID=48140 RepID=A0A9P3GEJ0_9APHY|nr:zinc finger MYND domain-containing protein [Phanerochaete sordida]
MSHWAEVFPARLLSSLGQRSTPDIPMRQRSFEVPSAWPRLTRELCVTEYAAQDKVQEVHLRLAVLVDAVTNAPDAVWHSACQEGMLSAVAEAIRREFAHVFCRELHVSAQSVIGLHYICHMMRLSRTTAGHLRDHNFRNLCQPLGCQGRDYKSLNILFDTLTVLGPLIVSQLRRHRSIQILDTRIAHVFFLVWIHATSENLRARALSHLCILTDYENDTDLWADFLDSALDGCTDGKHAIDAVVRDLKNEGVVDIALGEVFAFISTWYRASVYKNVAEEGSSEGRLAPGVLAAARRQLCRGSDIENIVDAGLMAFITQTCDDTYIPALRGYGFLDLLCHCVTLELPKDNLSPQEHVNAFLRWALEHAPSFSGEHRPKAVAARCRVHAAWKTVGEQLQSRMLARRVRSRPWRVFMKQWSSVEAILGKSIGEGRTPPVGLLERCAWRECLCSVYKPAHRMRTCKGCEWVVYCGERCQKSDWGRGGHREHCRRVAQ